MNCRVTVSAKILGYIEPDLDEAKGIAKGWSIQMENPSGVGFSVTDELFASEGPSKAFLQQALSIDETLIRANEEPRFIVYSADGRKKELPIFEVDQRSLHERIPKASRNEPDEKANIFSVIREVFEK